MKNTFQTVLLSVLVAGTTLLNGSVVLAEDVVRAKAAELALHRVERLVVLRKIDQAFQNKYKGLKLSVLDSTEPNAPKFQVTIEQLPNAEGKSALLEIPLTREGKALQHTVIPGPSADAVPTWPDKDPVTLSENALHYILENASHKPELVPFYENLSGLSVAQATLADGSVSAVVKVTSTTTSQILQVAIKQNGDFDSASLLENAEGN